MPIHDWTRVSAGTFHHFHVAWIPLLSNVLNEGVLPAGYYAMAEQIAGIVPDVLTLQAIDEQGIEQSGGGTAVAVSPPQVAITATLPYDVYAAKANHLVIRHESQDRVVAILKIVSPGNKSSRTGIDQFLKKAATALWDGIHLLVIDLHPPTRRDPEGIHGAIWEALGGQDDYVAPPDKPLTLAAYAASVRASPIEAFLQPVAVGDSLPPMLLFLTHERYVNVPLESSYQQAVASIPLRARRPLEP